MKDNQEFLREGQEIKAPISKEMVKKSHKKANKSSFVVSLVFFSFSFAVLCAVLVFLDSTGIIPGELFKKILLGVGVLAFLEVLLLVGARNNKVVAYINVFICLVTICASIIGIYALQRFIDSMNTVEEEATYYAHVGVYVKNDSRFVSLIDEKSKSGNSQFEVPLESLNGCSIGTMLLNVDAGYTSQAIRLCRKENEVEVIAYDDFGSMIDALKNDEIDAIIYNESYMAIYLGDDTDFYDWAVEINSIGIETEHKATAKKAEVTSEPFIVYVSGLDTSNKDNFNNNSRSDVNIIAAVDPVNKKILLINTPRDYYVPLWGKSYAMDKLTHAGVYGVDCSIKTLEALYDTEFNYYVRTNIHSLIRIVDALGGITVHSDYEFLASSYGKEHQFIIGDNEIDGDAALLFIRERTSFQNGDKQRGMHQQEVIRAIIEKACSPAIVAHFSDVLDVVTKSVQTNIGKEEIYALIKMQLSDMASWTVEMKSVDGYGSMEHSYAIGMALDPVWVMIPYEKTVREAKEALTSFMTE